MNQHSTRNTRMEIHWVGMDVSKDSFDASFVRRDQHFPDTELREIPTRNFKRSPEGVQAFLDWLDTQEEQGEEVRVVMEATGKYSTDLTVWLLLARPALAPAIVNPRHTSAFITSMGVRNKTDALEARALGFYGVERHPIAYERLTPERAELRDLSRYRQSLVQQRTALKNRKGEGSDSAFVEKNQAKRLRLLNKDIERVEAEMADVVEQHEDLKRDVALLSSIYGVAFINATTILAELGELRRFGLARQLTAFAGMSPRHHQSGTSIHRRSRLCKQGNPRIRQCLYLSAMIAIRGDNLFRRTYHRLLEQGKPKMVALAAIMRKLLTVMRAILISGQPYQPLGITRETTPKTTTLKAKNA